MIYYLTYLKDSIGSNYLGLKIPDDSIKKYLDKLKDILGEEAYIEYTTNQQNRDHNSYHSTVVNVMDYNRLSSEYGVNKFINSLEVVFETEIDDFKMLGLGSASRNENTTYFVVCESEKLKIIRERYKLPEHDFHITLGFKHKDVFGVRKNKVLEEHSNFLKVFKSEFYKKENFNFIKDISNYEEDKDLDIIPIELNKSYLKILVGDIIMDIGINEDKLFIFTRYKKTEDVKRLPMTEIYKLLK